MSLYRKAAYTQATYSSLLGDIHEALARNVLYNQPLDTESLMKRVEETLDYTSGNGYDEITLETLKEWYVKLDDA